MAALETSLWLNLSCNLQMALWTDRCLKYPCQDTMLTPCTWPPKWHWFPVSSCSALVPRHFDHNQRLCISIPQCCSYYTFQYGAWSRSPKVRKRLERSLNSVKVLEKYLISLLGLEKSLKFTTLFTSHIFWCTIILRRKNWLILNLRTCKNHG